MRRSAPRSRPSEPPASGVPPGAPAWVDEALLSETIRVWQPYYADTLTAADALEIVRGAAGLLEVVAEDIGERRGRMGSGRQIPPAAS